VRNLSREPLRVYISIDTEVWPHTPTWRETCLAEDIERDIYGHAEGGISGLEFQLELFQAEGLKAIFFVEPFSSVMAGREALRTLTGKVHAYGQEVQAHPHTEWLQWIENSPLAGKTGPHFRSFFREDQTTLIQWALSLLSEAGARSVCALRAGNFGANHDTLRAAAKAGLQYDFSLNHCALHRACEIYTSEPLLQPTMLSGIMEYPLAFFSDRPGHLRQAQICACSTREMLRALEQAWDNGWSSFVILMHSFEFLRDRKGNKKPRQNPIGLRRFEAVCKFLARNRERFETTHCSMAPGTDGTQRQLALKGLLRNTAIRYVEQLYVRLS
jgi:hypothetical protein